MREYCRHASEERSLQEVCSQNSVDKTTCKSYAQHLDCLNAKNPEKQ